MRAYILGVCGAVILSAFLFLLLPRGKIGKFIGGVLKLFCVAVMLLPVPNMLRSFGQWDGTESGATVALDGGCIAGMCERRAGREGAGRGVRAEIAWAEADYAYRVTGVAVCVEDFGIYGEDRHIFVIEQVENRLVALYGADVEVNVYV